jgi:hypothetical protein
MIKLDEVLDYAESHREKCDVSEIGLHVEDTLDPKLKLLKVRCRVCGETCEWLLNTEKPVEDGMALLFSKSVGISRSPGDV